MSLSISRVVEASLTTSSSSATTEDFGILNIITAETAFTRAETSRSYTSSTYSDDWDSDTEAYAAAQAFFSQSPTPSTVIISQRYEDDQPAFILGGSPSDVDDFTSISDGSFEVDINGTTTTITGLDFTSDTTFAEIATTIQNSVDTAGTFSYNSDEGVFMLESADTGEDVTIGYLTTASEGTDLSEMLGMDSADNGATLVDGLDGETITDSLDRIYDADTTAFYFFCFTNEIRDDATVNSESAVEAAMAWAESNSKVFINVTNDTDTKRSAVSTDVASVAADNSYKYTMTIYSSYAAQYPCASVAGRLSTVDFDSSNSVINMMFKTLPDITTESITTSVATILDGKNCNYYTTTAGVKFFQTGVMGSGAWIDEVHGLDALINYMQVAVTNLFLDKGKVPYTNKGVAQIVAVIKKVLDKFVRNGLLSAGYYEDDNGDEVYLENGYLVTTTDMSDISTSTKQTREYGDIELILVLAGAINKVTITGTTV